MKLLENKIALVTGGSRGIGKAIAILFASHGAQVFFTYKSSKDKALEVENQLNALTSGARAIQVDAADYEAVQNTVKSIAEATGNRVDILVNNAGITRDNLLLRMTPEQWDEVIRNNLNSVYNYTKAVASLMLRQRQGSIINVSSVVGLTGNAGQANYAASKAGIIGFTKSIAKELGVRNIRCNVIAPGFIETDMTATLDEQTIKAYHDNIPLRRFGSADEVARTALFLASDWSSYITGQVISVCGGMYS